MHELLGCVYSPLSWSSCKSATIFSTGGLSTRRWHTQGFFPWTLFKLPPLGQKPVCQAISWGTGVYKYQHLHQVGTAWRHCLTSAIQKEGKRSFHFLLLFIISPQSSTPSSCRSPHRGPFGVFLGQDERMSLLHVMWKRENLGILQRMLRCQEWPLCLIRAVWDDSFLFCTIFEGGWIQVAMLQIFFSIIFCLKVFSHFAVINTSFSGQVISISAEPRKKSFLPPTFPQENLC